MEVIARRDDGSIELYYDGGYFYYVDRNGKRHREKKRRITKRYVILTFELDRYKSKIYVHKKYVEHLIEPKNKNQKSLTDFF